MLLQEEARRSSREVVGEMLESWNFSGADSRSTIAANKSYRCNFTDPDDRIQSFEQIECENDAEAALKTQMLLGASQFTTAEL
jgi:hypothetical protein